MSVLIHCEPSIPWHQPFAHKMRTGLKKIGIRAGITPSRVRESDTAILLGTTLWRQIEDDQDWLLVDRCSFGDTNEWVSLVWNGHGRRGDHRVPDTVTPERWETVGCYVVPWIIGGKRVVLCGQTETYSPDYPTLESFYASVNATHFRKHPAGDGYSLPLARSWKDTRVAITLNSSVGVDALFHGIPVMCLDEGSMAWDMRSKSVNDLCMDDRREWLHWLAWTQWHHDEIRDGEPIRHLFETL